MNTPSVAALEQLAASLEAVAEAIRGLASPPPPPPPPPPHHPPAAPPAPDDPDPSCGLACPPGGPATGHPRGP
jgi:hypothetical protein